MSDLLTWEEICKRYPGQHLGVTNIETEADGVNIRRAVVLYSGDTSRKDLLLAVANSGGSIRSVYTPREDYADVATTGYVSV